jgi:hypothetical protein
VVGDERKETPDGRQSAVSCPDQEIWQGGAARFYLDAPDAADQLRAAIEAETSVAKGVILALDATDALGQVTEAVRNEFQKRYRDWARGLGFDSIWVVGRTAELTFRLD